MSRDVERFQQFLEDVAIHRFRSAVARGEMPNWEDLEAVAELLSEYQELRPGIPGRRYAEAWDRVRVFLDIERARLRGDSLEVAIEDVVPKSRRDRFTRIYARGRHPDEREMAREMAQIDGFDLDEEFQRSIDGPLPPVFARDKVGG